MNFSLLLPKHSANLSIFLLLLTGPLRGHLQAHGGGGDVAVFATQGRVDIGSAILDDNDDVQLSFNPDDNVFAAIMSPQVLFGFSLGATEPGLDGNEGLLPGNASVSIQTQGIRYWSGTGPIAFTSPSDVAAKYATEPVVTNIRGGFHYHPLLGLIDLTSDGHPVASGVYLIESTLRVQGLLDSAPFYTVALVDTLILQSMDPESAVESLRGEVFAYLADTTAARPSLGGKDFTFFADAVKYVQAVPEPSVGRLLLGSLCPLGNFRKTSR